jgi:hypothetical protein
MVRRVLVVLSLSFICLSCATPRPAPPAVIKATPLSVSALIKRDNLERFFELSEGFVAKLPRESARISTVELNGVAPPELVIETSQKVSEDEWVEAMWLYDVTDPANPVRIHSRNPAALPHEAPHVAGLHWLTMDGSRRWIKDLDGDGRAELVWSSDAQDSPTDLAILGWGELGEGERGIRDMLWSDPMGKHVLIADVEDDCVSEVVSLDLHEAAADRLAVIRKLEDGIWRVDERGQSGYQLQRILEALIEDVDQPDHVGALVFMVGLLRERGVSPRDVAALQRRLEALLAFADAEGSGEVQDLLYGAMVWPDNPRAYELLSQRLRDHELPSPTIADALLRLDAAMGQTRGREAVLARLELSLEPLPIERDELTELLGIRFIPLKALLEALEAHKLEDGAARLARHLATPALSQELYDEIVHQQSLMQHLGGQRALLRPLWTDEALVARRAGIVDGMGAVLLLRDAPWRVMMTAKELRALLADKRLTKLEHAYVAAQGLSLGDASFARDLTALIAWLEADEATQLFYALARQRAPLPARAALKRWLRDAGDGHRVYTLLYWALASGGVPVFAELAAELRGAPQLGGLAMFLSELLDAECEGGACALVALDDAVRDKLYALIQKLLPSGTSDQRASLFEVMGRLERPAAAAHLLEVVQREPSLELRAAARGAMIRHPHPLTVPYLFSEAMGGAEDAADIFGALAAHLDAASLARVQELVLTRTSDATDPVYRAQIQLLADVAPRICPADSLAFWKVAFSGEDPCEGREALMQMLTLCKPEELAALFHERVLTHCGLGLAQSALDVIAERGTRAHLPVLSWLKLSSSSRSMRDRVTYAMEMLTKRLNKP